MPTITQPNQHEIKHSILAVLEDNPIDTLQFISSSLQFIGTSLDHKPQLSDTNKEKESQRNKALLVYQVC